MEWINLAQSMDYKQNFVNTVMNLGFFKILGNPRVPEQLVAYQDGLS
jgi:hypothetical protein